MFTFQVTVYVTVKMIPSYSLPILEKIGSAVNDFENHYQLVVDNENLLNYDKVCK